MSNHVLLLFQSDVSVCHWNGRKAKQTQKLCQIWRWFESGSVAYLICNAGIWNYSQEHTWVVAWEQPTHGKYGKYFLLYIALKKALNKPLYLGKGSLIHLEFCSCDEYLSIKCYSNIVNLYYNTNIPSCTLAGLSWNDIYAGSVALCLIFYFGPAVRVWLLYPNDESLHQILCWKDIISVHACICVFTCQKPHRWEVHLNNGAVENDLSQGFSGLLLFHQGWGGFRMPSTCSKC